MTAIESSWFSSWFDTHYYHILYQNRDDNEAQRFIQQLIGYLRIPTDRLIVDLACGKGRHAKHINSLGYPTIGIDLSSESIAEAKRYENDSLHFIVGDMRHKIHEFTTTEAESLGSAGAVFNLFTSFGYFNSQKENLMVLQSMESMLAEGGRFVIDFLNAKKVIDNLIPEESKTIDGIHFNIKRQILNGQVIKKIEVIDGTTAQYFEERVQLLTIEDFRNLSAQTNLRIDSAFGNYSLERFDSEQSERLIIIGSKT